MPALDVQFRNRAPYLAINVSGHYLTPDQLRLVRSVKVEHNKDKADTMQIIFEDPDLLIVNGGLVTPKSLFVIHCGRDDEVIKKGPFRVSEWKPQAPANGRAALIVEGTSQDVSKMAVKAKSVSYNGMKPSEIVKKIGDQYGFDFDVDILPLDDVQFDDDYGLNQVQKSDANLLQKLADKLGYVWGVRNGTLYFNRPDQFNNNPLIFEWRVGKKTLKSFKPKIKIYKQGRPKANLCAPVLDSSKAAYGIMLQAEHGYQDGIAQTLGIRTITKEDVEVSPGFIQQASKYAVKISDIDPAQLAFTGGAGSDGGVGIKDFKEQINRLDKTTTDLGNTFNELKQSISRPKRKKSRKPEQSVGEKVVGGVKKFVSYSLDENNLELLKNNIEEKQDALTKAVSRLNQENDQLTVARPDRAEGIPRDEERAKKFIAKQVKQRAIAVEATLEPTVPSWVWETTESVYVLGVADMCEGLYYVNKATLTYDRDKALGTVLECKKGTIGRKKSEKDCKKGKPEVCIYDKLVKFADINPRKTLENPKNRKRITEPPQLPRQKSTSFSLTDYELRRESD